MTPQRQVVVVDGGSGAGKTTWAHRLADELRAQGRRVQVVSLDDFYPGWHGLAAASDIVVDDVLGRGRYHRWDWEQRRWADEVVLDPDADWVIEGCGALTPASARRATRTVWLELDADSRRERALGRSDGDGFRPWWDVWAQQEADHWRRHRPRELADEVLLVEPTRTRG